MLKSFLVLSLILIQSLIAQAQVEPLLAGCELELVQVGKGVSTDLQKEAEIVLQLKGYTLTRKDAETLELPILAPFRMQAEYTAGNASPTGESDCIVEDYRDFGKRATCHYELKLKVMDVGGIPRTVFHLRQSIRQSLDARVFFDGVRAGLAQMPQCALL